MKAFSVHTTFINKKILKNCDIIEKTIETLTNEKTKREKT